jgi:3-methyladenine DNA glycosylase AlkD
VRRADCEAKLWLRPGLPDARSRGFSSRELRDIRKLIEENREQIERAWAEFFG